MWEEWEVSFLLLFAWRRVKDGSFRFLAVTVRREVQVVAGSLGHSFQQSAIHPVYDRSIQLSRTVEANAILIKVRYKYILHLKIAAGMQKRNGVHEAFQ